MNIANENVGNLLFLYAWTCGLGSWKKLFSDVFFYSYTDVGMFKEKSKVFIKFLSQTPV